MCCVCSDPLGRGVGETWSNGGEDEGDEEGACSWVRFKHARRLACNLSECLPLTTSSGKRQVEERLRLNLLCKHEPSPSLQHLPKAALHAEHERTEQEQLSRRSRHEIPAASAPHRAQHTHIQADLASFPAVRGDSQHWGKALLPGMSRAAGN